MFKITKDKTFEREVTVVTPTDKGSTTGTFTGVFRILNEGALHELSDDGDIARGVLKSVKDVGDENGNELPPDEALEAVLADTGAVTAITVLYFKERKSKNLRRKN